MTFLLVFVLPPASLAAEISDYSGKYQLVECRVNEHGLQVDQVMVKNMAEKTIVFKSHTEEYPALLGFLVQHADSGRGVGDIGKFAYQTESGFDEGEFFEEQSHTIAVPPATYKKRNKMFFTDQELTRLRITKEVCESNQWFCLFYSTILDCEFQRIP